MKATQRYLTVPDESKMSRPLGQRIALVFALLFSFGAVMCAIGAFLYPSQEPGDPVQASLMASVVFFIGGGVVLQVIGTARLKGLLSGTAHPSTIDDGDR